MRISRALAQLVALTLASAHARCALAAGDASSREVAIRRSVSIAGANSREVAIRRSDVRTDAISREVVLFRSLGQLSVVSREFSTGFVARVTVPTGFLMREFASIPTGPAQWMALAVEPEFGDNPLDLYVASTTRQFGAPTDAPDDFVHRVRRSDLTVSEFAAFDSSETDPADLAFSWFDEGLFVAARHRDGYDPGDAGGAVLRLDDEGQESVVYSEPATAHSPLALATPPAGSSFAQALYVGNDVTLAPSAFALDAAGSLLPFAANLTASLGALAFAPGNAFGDGIYVGADDGIVRKVDAAGVVSSFSAPLGAGVQGLAFSSGFGFGELLYALLADGRIVRLDAAGVSEAFLSGLLIEPLSNDVVRNDLHFTPAGDILYVSDARRAKVYGVQVNPPTGSGFAGPAPSPPALALENHPNPFNPTTTLRFELAAPQTVDLVVHDSRGRRVRSLLQGERLPTGVHQVRWDGRDGRGDRVASGVYFALLRAGARVQSHKLVLAK